METLLYFLLWAGLIFLMMRFGCGAHVMGHGHRHGETKPERDTAQPGTNARWTPPVRDIDPVCGMTVETAGAKSSVYDGRVHYFCSQNCRDKFEASPASYAKSVANRTQGMAHSHDSHH